jgi:predicted glycoside hydrolase/deacetylase ChbG (UPF0249 family)
VAADFEGFFEALGRRPVVMCHPGHVDAELGALDPVTQPRAREYAYLASDAFQRLLEERAVALVSLPGPPGAPLPD